MNDLGQKIKELRKSRHLKQDDLAQILNLSRSAISNLECSRRSLSLEQLKKLCTYFKIDMDYFGITPDAEETISLIERAKLLFESDIPEEKKDELHLILMQIYLNSKDNKKE